MTDRPPADSLLVNTTQPSAQFSRLRTRSCRVSARGVMAGGSPGPRSGNSLSTRFLCMPDIVVFGPVGGHHAQGDSSAWHPGSRIGATTSRGVVIYYDLLRRAIRRKGPNLHK